jgi:hypothetical protein
MLYIIQTLIRWAIAIWLVETYFLSAVLDVKKKTSFNLKSSLSAVSDQLCLTNPESPDREAPFYSWFYTPEYGVHWGTVVGTVVVLGGLPRWGTWLMPLTRPLPPGLCLF